MSSDTQPEAGQVKAVEAAISAVRDDPQWPRGCVASTATPLAAFEIMSLLYPELVQYRGGLFRACAFKPENADGFFDQTGGDLASVEYVMNHLHVDEDLFGQSEPMSLEISRAICEMIALGWRTWALERYGLHIRTSVICEEDQREVSFRSKNDR